MQLKKITLNTKVESNVYPFNVPFLKNLKEINFEKQITILVGENGSGKSTLIEGLAMACNLPTIGDIDIKRDKTLSSAKDLAEEITLSWGIRNHRGFFMRAEDFFGFQKRIAQSQAELKEQEEEFNVKFTGYAKLLATGAAKAQRQGLESRYGENPDAFSHGESFLNLFIQRLVPEGLYILDEPEVPLSPQRQLSLISLIKKQIDLNSQFIIATHSPILMALPNADILEIKNGQINKVKYSDLEHVSLMRDFLSNPETFIRFL